MAQTAGVNANRIADLEQQYMKLLEGKIARLESEKSRSKKASNAILMQGIKPPFPPPPPPPPPAGLSIDRSSDVEDSDDEEQPRHKIVISRWDPTRGEYVEETKKDLKKKIGPENKPNEAFVFRKIVGQQLPIRIHRESPAVSVGSEVEIKTEALQSLIQKVTSRWGLSELSSGKMRSPFENLMHSWDDAWEESERAVPEETEDERTARMDLGALLDIIKTSSGDPRLDKYLRDRDSFRKDKTISHEALWTLFPPGTLVLSRPCLNEWQVFSVESCDGFVSGRHNFELIAYSLDWNGSEFNRVPYELTIENWGEDRKSIVELPVYPLQYHEEGGKSPEQSIKDLKNVLIERGKKFRKYCIAGEGKQMFNYDGDAFFHKNSAILYGSTGEDGRRYDDNSSDSEEINALRRSAGAVKKAAKGAIMVDYASFAEYQPTRIPILGSLPKYEGQMQDLSPDKRENEVFKEMYKFDWDGLKPKQPMKDEQYLLCPPRVLGYALKQKKWAQFLVEKISPANEANDRTFQKDLQLKNEAKSLISKSVRAHEKGKEKIDGSNKTKGLDDFAPEKGKGLVIMLYGLPGVGKTLTAESVAQMTGKPLLSVGVSDIGIEGDKVEMNLQKVFDLAGTWGAVLLFDEADVFLEARGEGENDLRRNAMVSVLLRVLEYYDGILILTTNRMRSFDIAVQSRIHLAVKYGELSGEQKKAIFNSFISQLEGKDLLESPSEIRDWIDSEVESYDFNGRQIRNIVSTALGIALADDRKLRTKDLNMVSKQTDIFKRDLSSQEAVYKDRQIALRY